MLRLEKLKEVLSMANARAAEEKGSSLDFFKLLINPQSFTQVFHALCIHVCVLGDRIFS